MFPFPIFPVNIVSWHVVVHSESSWIVVAVVVDKTTSFCVTDCGDNLRAHNVVTHNTRTFLHQNISTIIMLVVVKICPGLNQSTKQVGFVYSVQFECIENISSWIIGRILRSLVSDIFLHFVCTSRESESPLSLLASPVSLCVWNMKYAWDVMSCDDDINCMSGIH